MSVILFALLIAGCAHPPKVSTALSVKRKSGGTLVFSLKVKNLENMVTTPLLVTLTAEMRNGAAWSKPEDVIHPAAFVLNRNEEQTLTANVKSDAEAVRTMLTVKEGENGHLLKTERSQIAVPAE